MSKRDVGQTPTGQRNRRTTGRRPAFADAKTVICAPFFEAPTIRSAESAELARLYEEELRRNQD